MLMFCAIWTHRHTSTSSYENILKRKSCQTSCHAFVFFIFYFWCPEALYPMVLHLLWCPRALYPMVLHLFSSWYFQHITNSLIHHKALKTHFISHSCKHALKHYQVISHSHFHKSYFKVHQNITQSTFHTHILKHIKHHQNISQHIWKHWKDTQNILS